MAQTKHVTLPVEPGSLDAFAPFGELVLPPSGEPIYKGIQASTWPTGFHCDDNVQLIFSRFGWQEPRFTKLERHWGVSQTFAALMPRAFVMVVAPSSPRGAWPDPAGLRAFTVPAGAAVIIGEGIWHALDRFLFEREPLDCLMLTSQSVQAELEANYRHGQPTERTDIVDFAERGVEFRLDMAAPSRRAASSG